MRIVDVDEGLEEARDILSRGGLVAVPTETVYGLAADASDPDAVARIYAAKGRPAFNPLIVHVASIGAASDYAHISERALDLMEEHWPGPLTIVLPLKPGRLAPAVTAGLATVALRNPRGPLARLAVERGLAAPSANRSGHVSPTCAAHVADDLGEAVDLVLDGGECPVGVESTVIAVEGDAIRLLRPGAIEIADAKAGTGDVIEAPGMMRSHYAPSAAMRLNVTEPNEGEAMLGFGAVHGDLNLSEGADVEEAARNLFAMLRVLDGRAGRIAVAPVPNHGIGRAVNDRLARAAAPRGT